MKKIFIFTCLLMVSASLQAFSREEGKIQTKIPGSVTPVSSQKTSVRKEGGWDVGLNAGLLYAGPGLDVMYKMKRHPFAIGMSGGIGLGLLGEAFSRYYPFKWSSFQPYLSGGVTYYEPWLLDGMTMMVRTFGKALGQAIGQAMVEALGGKSNNTFEPEVEEIHSRFLGPTLKCGFDVPIWRLFLSLEGGGSLVHELTDFYDKGWRLFPTTAVGIKYRF